MEEAERRGIGLSAFLSVGNKADVSGNDLLEWWEQDEDTDAVLLYVESFGNPRRFARIARRVARTTPIVAVKAGRSKAGARAAASHTGRLLAASDATVDALFHHAGVIRVGHAGRAARHRRPARGHARAERPPRRDRRQRRRARHPGRSTRARRAG